MAPGLADDGRGLGEGREAQPLFAGVADRAGDREIRGHAELVAGDRGLGQPQHLHGHRREGLLDPVAVVVDKGLDATPGRPRDDGLADAEDAPLHDDRRHRPAADVKVRLEDGAPCVTFGVGAQL